MALSKNLRPSRVRGYRTESSSHYTTERSEASSDPGSEEEALPSHEPAGVQHGLGTPGRLGADWAEVVRQVIAKKYVAKKYVAGRLLSNSRSWTGLANLSKKLCGWLGAVELRRTVGRFYQRSAASYIAAAGFPRETYAYSSQGGYGSDARRRSEQG